MTVKNYVLDINKTSLQHPSIVLRQDDYNIYTVNISVTDNGVPVNLGSYTLNFLGITPAGAKIIDSKNFITTPADLAAGKFSYRFPKEAAGSKGVYDVAYFRLKTTSGATSTIDLNLRVLGGIDLTADEVKDYITVDDTLRNTLVSEVFKKVDAKVDEHLATVKKGDKGDPGKDAEMPVIGGRNYLLNSAFLNGFQGWNNENNSWTIDSSTYQGNPVIKSPTTTGSGSRLVQRFDNPPASGTKVTVSFNAKGNDSNSIVLVVLFNANAVRVPLTSTFSKYTVSFTIPNDFGVPQIYFWNTVVGDNVFLNYIKLETGNVATDWTPAPEDVPSNDAQLVHKTGNEVIAGDKTFTSNTTLATTTLLAGNYGLRVTPSGFQKTTDGKTWVSANI